MRSAALLLLTISSFAHCDPCPDGYKLSPSGEDCYMKIDFYDTFATQFFAKSYVEAEAACNSKSGGMLASVHSKEDNDILAGMGGCRANAPGTTHNIGLRCQGKVCKWDDGTPMTYVNFKGDGPQDDGRSRCYFVSGSYPNPGGWDGQDCGKQEHDCWICRVKAKKIDCVDGETEYKGGCVSVHTTPLDQKTGEESCPGGGHLVSIHSLGLYAENELYKQLALNSGVNGTIYIGGHYSNGVFEWFDGSYYGATNWANSFPNTVFGTCVQMLLASEFGVQGQWTNVDCSVKQPYICLRDGATFDPVPPSPKAPYYCPALQYYTGSGSIYSPNYPLSIPSQQTCEYVLGTVEGTRPSVTFNSYDCQSGTTLALYDGLNTNEPFLIFNGTAPSLTQSYTTTTFTVMKMVFTASGDSPPVGTGWAAEFNGV